MGIDNSLTSRLYTHNSTTRRSQCCGVAGRDSVPVLARSAQSFSFPYQNSTLVRKRRRPPNPRVFCLFVQLNNVNQVTEGGVSYHLRKEKAVERVTAGAGSAGSAAQNNSEPRTWSRPNLGPLATGSRVGGRTGGRARLDTFILATSGFYISPADRP
ncbi:hypothetical protein J6590_034401 [Homalodisca vitripennis]|nr:hypothetical protein J6590_034401 [Homalodisca vitripennis]